MRLKTSFAKWHTFVKTSMQNIYSNHKNDDDNNDDESNDDVNKNNNSCTINIIKHSKNKVVKWTTLGLSNWCQKRTPQSRPKLVIWVSRRMTTLMSSQKQPKSRQMTTFFTGFSVIWRLSYHLRTTEWQTSNRQMMVLWLICDKS